MPKIVSFINQKGGAGKSTLAVNLLCAFHLSLSSDGLKVVLVDADPQGTALSWKSKNDDSDLLVLGMQSKGLIKQVVSLSFDLVLIDTKGSFDEVIGETVAVSDIVLIPVRPSAPDFWAAEPVVDLIKMRQSVNPNLKAAFVITQDKPNTLLSKEIDLALTQFGFPVLYGTSELEVYKQTMATGDSVMNSKNTKARDEISALVESIFEL
jgi:chromosome partitioning protein